MNTAPDEIDHLRSSLLIVAAPFIPRSSEFGIHKTVSIPAPFLEPLPEVVAHSGCRVETTAAAITGRLYLTQTVFQVFLLESTFSQIRQLILHISNNKG